MIPLICALALASSVAKRGPVSLESLCRRSDAIVIGQIVRVVAVPRPRRPSDPVSDTLPERVPVAEVRVDEVLDGPAGIDTVLFVAAPRWACDVTSAIEGQNVFLFLGDTSDDALLDADFRGSVRDVFPKGELMNVAASGDGEMPLTGTCVEFRAIRPKDCPRVDAHDSSCAHPGRCVPFAWIHERIPRICEEQRKPWIRASVTDVRRGQKAWDLEIRGNRRVRLVVHEADGDRETTFRAGNRAVACFEGNVDWTLKDPTPARLGKGEDPSGERHLEILGGPRYELRISALDPEWMSRPENLAAIRPALELWKEIRDLITDPYCADHRSTDRPWIDRR